MAQWRIFEPNHAARRLAGEWATAQIKFGDFASRSWMWAAEPVMYLARALKDVGADSYEAVWRVECRDVGPIRALRIGLPISDEPGDNVVFETWPDVPEWMQDRVRALSMISGSPPTKWIDGLGRRMSEDVYWVVK